MAQPLFKSKNDEFDLVRIARHQVRLTGQTASASADRLEISSSFSDDLAGPRNGYIRGLAATGAATIIVLSILTGTLLAGLAVLGSAMAIRWALVGFGNWILDNTL